MNANTGQQYTYFNKVGTYLDTYKNNNYNNI